MIWLPPTVVDTDPDARRVTNDALWLFRALLGVEKPSWVHPRHVNVVLSELSDARRARDQTAWQVNMQNACFAYVQGVLDATADPFTPSWSLRVTSRSVGWALLSELVRERP